MNAAEREAVERPMIRNILSLPLIASLLCSPCAPTPPPPARGAEVVRVDLPAAVVWSDGAGVTVVWSCE